MQDGVLHYVVQSLNEAMKHIGGLPTLCAYKRVDTIVIHGMESLPGAHEFVCDEMVKDALETAVKTGATLIVSPTQRPPDAMDLGLTVEYSEYS